MASSASASDLDAVLAWVALTGSCAPDLARAPDSRSPELDDDGLPAEPGAPPRARVKYHGCAVCELRVVGTYHEPDLAAAAAAYVAGARECSYVPQWGPVCGAASVASTALSLLRAPGGPPPPPGGWEAVVTVRLVQDVYTALGVPGVLRTTAAVGNGAIKKAFATLRVPGLEGGRFAVTELAATLAATPADRADAEWARLKAGFASGARYLYHSRNHYARVFGWRELFARTPDAQPADGASGVAVAAEGGEGAPAAAAAAAAEPKPEPKLEPALDAGAAADAADAAGGGDDENAGAAAPRARAPAASAAAAPVDAAEANPFGTGKRGIAPLAPAAASAGNAAPAAVGAAAKAAKAAAVRRALGKPAPPPAPPATGDGLTRTSRQVLMAKKGQRPQHWVAWESVAEDTRTHALHTIFEVRLLLR